MTLRQLRIFAEVAREGTFSAAASRLSLTQPAVSIQMRRLQHELGVTLLRPAGRRLKLTGHGDRLLDYARRIVRLADEARLVLQTDDGERRVVMVAASSTPGIYLLPRIMARYRRREPNMLLRLFVANTETVERNVSSGEADLGVVGGRLTSAELVAEPWRDDELVLIVSPQHRLARRPTVSARDLADESLLAREQGSATRMTYETAFMQAGLPLPNAEPLGDTEAIKRAVAAGLGISIVSRFAVDDELRSGGLRALRVRGITLRRPLQILHSSTRELSSEARSFLTYLRGRARRR